MLETEQRKQISVKLISFQFLYTERVDTITLFILQQSLTKQNKLIKPPSLSCPVISSP